ncbi:MAG: hypothetical protein WCH04_21485 [Gammaproteobacteria bacterium]
MMKNHAHNWDAGCMTALNTLLLAGSLMDNINNTELRCYDAMFKVGLFHE